MVDMGVVVVVALAFVVQLFLAMLTADDARKRGQGGIGWFIIVLILGILGIIIYLITRNDKRLPKDERTDFNGVSFAIAITMYTVIPTFVFLFIFIISAVIAVSLSLEGQPIVLICLFLGLSASIASIVGVYQFRKQYWGNILDKI